MIIRGEPIDVYHKHPTALSSSRIKDYLQGGPLLYQRSWEETDPEKRWERKQTPAMLAGQGFEDYYFEQPTFNAKYAMKPKALNLAKTTDPKVKEWLEANAGKIRLAGGEDVDFPNMKQSMDEYPELQMLLASGEKQVTLRHTSETMGVIIQSRPDFIGFQGNDKLTGGLPYTIDLKKTKSMDDWFDMFDARNNPISGRPIIKYRHHVQGAMVRYNCMQEPELGPTMQFLCVVETAQPYRCQLIKMHQNYLELGMLDVEKAAEMIVAHRKTGIWQRGLGGILELEPPVYLEQKAMRQWDLRD